MIDLGYFQHLYAIDEDRRLQADVQKMLTGGKLLRYHFSWHPCEGSVSVEGQTNSVDSQAMPVRAVLAGNTIRPNEHRSVASRQLADTRHQSERVVWAIQTLFSQLVGIAVGSFGRQPVRAWVIDPFKVGEHKVRKK